MNKLNTKIFSILSMLAAVIFFTSAVPAFASTAQPFEKLFYYVPGFNTYYSYEAHGDKADIFAPQVYGVDNTGTLKGSISAMALSVANKNQTKIMPLVANSHFSSDTMHTILTSTTIQNRIIKSLIVEAKAQNYIGWQFDFENIPATDRDAYSQFVERAAKAFHTARPKLKLSVAMIARFSEDPNDIPALSWDHWAGAYDYQRIGAAADFVTLMAYDDPNSLGPVASIAWVKKVLAYTEQSIPRSKISLGVPTYGWIWNTDTNTRIRSTNYQKVADLLSTKTYDAKGYDKSLQASWITYTKDAGSGIMAHYKIWYEDAKSFKAKLALAKSEKLRGISLWIVGMENPDIWNVI